MINALVEVLRRWVLDGSSVEFYIPSLKFLSNSTPIRSIRQVIFENKERFISRNRIPVYKWVKNVGIPVNQWDQ